MFEGNEKVVLVTEKTSASAWTDDLNNAFEDLINGNKLSPEAKKGLEESQSKWLDFQKEEEQFFDKLLPADNAQSMKERIVRDRVRELQALHDSKLTPPDQNQSIDRKLQRCLSMSPTPVNTVGCLIDAANDWQIKKNRLLSDMVTEWKPETKAALSKSERAWEEFARAEDEFLGQAFPNDGPDNAGINRLKAEINVVRDRALELEIINDRVGN